MLKDKLDANVGRIEAGDRMALQGPDLPNLPESFLRPLLTNDKHPTLSTSPLQPETPHAYNL
jgi:hypothetical protein